MLFEKAQTWSSSKGKKSFFVSFISLDLLLEFVLLLFYWLSLVLFVLLLLSLWLKFSDSLGLSGSSLSGWSKLPVSPVSVLIYPDNKTPSDWRQSY